MAPAKKILRKRNNIEETNGQVKYNRRSKAS